MTLVHVALPYAALCTAMVVADMVTAWSLGRRVRARYGSAAPEAGKLRSQRLGTMAVTLGKVYALLVVAAAADALLFAGTPVHAVRYAAGAVCLWQAVSVLENEASCSDSRWARIARRWLVDKARRHMDAL